MNGAGPRLRLAAPTMAPAVARTLALTVALWKAESRVRKSE